MKKSLIPFVLLLLAFKMNSSSLKIREQLKDVNSYWVYHPLTNKMLDGERVFASDRQLIQLHLQLVENELRAKSMLSLNEDQKKQRLKLLDILHSYWIDGLFPKNTGHTFRMPYFIDKYGTACAVGHLIIKSGFEAVATQISKENNNGYIFELVLKYPQIENWAKAHGFSIDELAWIQPCYTPPLDTAGVRHPTCHNAANGYFVPDFSQLQGPLIKSFYRWDGTGWIAWMDWCGDWLFHHVKAGNYKWQAKDSLNIVHTFSIELIAPPPATVSTISSGNFNTCNGVITVSVQGGITPFKYFWSGHTSTTSVLSSVCEELINLTFSEAGSWCPQYFEISTSPVGLQEEFINALQVSPNPVSDILQLKFDSRFKPGQKNAKVMNIHGQIVLRPDIQSEQTNISVSQLPPGLYFLQVDNYRTLRFVKE